MNDDGHVDITEVHLDSVGLDCTHRWTAMDV